MTHITRKAIIVVSLLLLAGCTTNVVVKGKYPEPLSHKIPVTAGLFFDPDFQAYTFSDESGRKDVEIKFGDAQMRLFQTIARGMFNKSVTLAGMPDNAAEAMISGVDLVIIPHVEEVQISMPYDTQLKVFEVWIKYNVQVFDGNGDAIADWIMTSYGKTPTRSLTSAGEALNLASIVALRDAGARITTGFAKVPEIRNWLHQQLAQRNPSAQESKL